MDTYGQALEGTPGHPPPPTKHLPPPTANWVSKMAGCMHGKEVLLQTGLLPLVRDLLGKECLPMLPREVGSVGRRCCSVLNGSLSQGNCCVWKRLWGPFHPPKKPLRCSRNSLARVPESLALALFGGNRQISKHVLCVWCGANIYAYIYMSLMWQWRLMLTLRPWWLLESTTWT